MNHMFHDLSVILIIVFVQFHLVKYKLNCDGLSMFLLGNHVLEFYFTTLTFSLFYTLASMPKKNTR